MRFRSVWLMVLATLLSGFVVMARPAAAAQEESRLTEVLKRGYVIIGTSSTAPPMGFIDEKGELVGFDIDIGRLIAKSLFDDPSKVKFVPQSYEARWASVTSGKVDLGIQSTAIYPDRLRKVAFTRAYVDSGISVLVRKDSGINHLSELNNPKYTMSILNNPQSAERHKQFTPNAKVLTFDSDAQKLLAVTTNQATATPADTPVVKYMAAKNADIVKVLPEMMSQAQNNAIFLKQGDFVWWHLLDALVLEMKEGSLYQDYTAIYRKWFGENPPPQRWYLGTK